MPTISIVKVHNPSWIWGRIFSCPGGDGETSDQYKNLMAQMNLFYHDVTQDQSKLKPVSVEEGQVCVVYWSVIKSWCRALVESIIVDSVSCKARCLLVDHAEQLVVSLDQVRVAVQNFLHLPFCVKRFHLARIKPLTLRVSVCEEKAKLKPSTRWDSSATLYLHKLLKISTQTEAVLLESKSDSMAIMLYVTVRNIKICVNDDLVAKKFGLYDSQIADGSGLDEADQAPIMLSSSILMQSSRRTSKKTTAQTQPPPGLAGFGAADWLTPSITPQSQHHELKISEDGSRSPGSRSESGSDCAAAESDSPGSSLAASLVRTLSQLRITPSSNIEPGTTQEQAELYKRARNGATCLDGSSQDKYLSDEETSSSSRSVEQAAMEPETTRRTEENWACSRLLEWLNPGPLNPDPDAADDMVVPNDPTKRAILVHSALPVEPCNGLDDAPILDSLRWVLRKKRYDNLSPAERYSWPAVACGCNTVVVSHNTREPLTYLIPLLTHILLNSIFTSLTSSAGPIAVLLCPSWEKVQVVYDLLEEMKVTSILHSFIVLLGLGKDEAKSVRIPKNCLMLVTTPFSLVRLLSCHCFLFLRLYHLVLDAADQLFSLAPEEMDTILHHFQKVTSSEKNTFCSQQVVALAERWTSQLERLLVNHMPYPCIVMTVPEEVALYGDIQQVIFMTLESSKTSVLLGMLDLNPDVGQKTLIVTNSAQEVEDVFKAVSTKSAFCLMTHEGLTQQFDLVIQQWRKDIGPGTHIFLVTTNECLKYLGIRDATCVIHYGFPTSPKVFGSRLFCMAQNIRNLSERTDTTPRVTRSVLLISERNARHGVGILRYMERTNALLPPELLSFVQGVLVAREDQKTDRPLCSYLKSFGVCRDSSVCPDRHRFISHLDQSVLPSSGPIEVLPLYIKTASVFYGRIVRKEDTGFQTMLAEMVSYYTDKRPGAKEMLEGGLYAVEEDEDFHRVKILSVPNRGNRLFFSVLVCFIDVGKEEEVKSYRILQLPEQFHSLPGQAVEIIVCRVKPADSETNWHPKVTRAISQKIQAVRHQARAVFSLGNTVFVDPMVRVSRMPGMKTVINEYNVQSEILNTGMAVSNPKHLDLLRVLCQEASHVSGSSDGPASLELRSKAEEVLAEAFAADKVSELPDLPHLEPLEPLSLVSRSQPVVPAPPELQAAPAAEPHPVPMCDEESLLVADLTSAGRVMRNRDEGEPDPVTSWTAALDHSEDSKGVNQSNSQQVTSTDADHNATKSFHPQVLWYQTLDSVIVTVKLTNPGSQHCDFYPDRVVYSGKANGRSYRADLELHASIAAERCCWEMKSNKPVLKLVKQQQGYWERFLTSKNIFVSFDMERIEEDEDRIPNGQWFVENTGEENSYVNSESGSESD